MTCQTDRPTVLFGGTFDPIHNGHLGLARAVLAQGAAEQALFMPARIPPHKKERRITSGAHRLAMLELAVASQPGLFVSDFELQREQVSFTIDTVHQLQTAFAENLLLLIGADSLRELSSWWRAQELVKTVPLVVYKRPGSALPTKAELCAQFGPIGTNLLDRVVEGPQFAISSTDIRHALMRRDSVESLVPHGVAEYIAKHNLYQPNGSST